MVCREEQLSCDEDEGRGIVRFFWRKRVDFAVFGGRGLGWWGGGGIACVDEEPFGRLYYAVLPACWRTDSCAVLGKQRWYCVGREGAVVLCRGWSESDVSGDGRLYYAGQGEAVVLCRGRSHIVCWGGGCHSTLGVG